MPFAVIGLGRFGGAELSYASDLDVHLRLRRPGAGGRRRGQAAGHRRSCASSAARPRPSGSTTIDADLRPEGKQRPAGPQPRAATTATGATYALTWERQAMTRARPVAGDRDARRPRCSTARAVVWDGGLDAEDDPRDPAHEGPHRARAHPAGEDPQFHLKLGRGSLSDVEFTAQLLQLQHGVQATGTVDALRGPGRQRRRWPPRTPSPGRSPTGSASAPATAGSS